MGLVTLERRDAVAVVTLNRPDALNALNSALLAELQGTFADIAREEGIHAVVLTGVGKAFAAGADIAEMKDFSPAEAHAYAEAGGRVLAAIEGLPQPVIAAVNGYALGGGCELALACDIRAVSERAKFGQPEVSLGIIPGFGGTQRLQRTVGTGWATRMTLTGETIDALKARQIGLADSVHAPETLLDEAVAMAAAMAKNAPLAVRAAKRAIRAGADADLAQRIQGEAALFAQCFATEDQKDAMTAFVEKRRLDGFKGK